MLDISLVLSQCFGPRKKEEEEKKRKLQAMKLAKLTKTAAFCVKVPLKYAKVVLFESSCCFTGSDSICAAFHLRRLYRLSGAAASQAQKEEEAQT